MCVLILYSVTLLNSLISSTILGGVYSLEFSAQTVMTSANKDSFISSFPIPIQ